MHHFELMFAYVRKFDQTKLEVMALSIYVTLSYAIVITFLNIGQVFPVGTDPFTYLSVADNFANGPRRFEFYDPRGGGSYLSQWMPLYPLLIAFLILLGFDVVTAAYMITIGFQGLVVFPLFYLAKDLFQRTIAHVSAVMYITSFPFIYISTFPIADTVFTFFIVFSLFLLNKALKSPRIVQTFVTGITVGLCYLTKPLGAMIFAFAILSFVLYKKKEEINVLKLLFTICIFGLAFFGLIVSWELAEPYVRLTGTFIAICAFFVAIYFNSEDKTDIIKKIRKIALFSVGCLITISWWLIRNYLRFADPFHWGQKNWYYTYQFREEGYNIWKAIMYSLSHIQIIRIISVDLFPLSVFIIISIRFLVNKPLQKKFLFLLGYPLLLSIFMTTYFAIVTRLLISGYPLLIVLETKTVFELRKLCQVSFKQRWPQLVILCIFVIHIIYNLCYSYLFFTMGIGIIYSTGMEQQTTLHFPERRIWY